jgi:hypothetical protein
VKREELGVLLSQVIAARTDADGAARDAKAAAKTLAAVQRQIEQAMIRIMTAPE